VTKVLTVYRIVCFQKWLWTCNFIKHVSCCEGKLYMKMRFHTIWGQNQKTEGKSW